MEIRTLRYFLAVAREENMTRAAEQLHVTQPTLSKALKALEDEVVFFARKTKYFNEIRRNNSKQSQYYVKCTENEKKTFSTLLTFFDLGYII